MRAHRFAIAIAMFALASCSVLNREGPTDTCADLQNGAVNACKDGIIASCDDGKHVRYRVCDDKSACEASWQLAGAYRCSDTDPSPKNGTSGQGQQQGGTGGSSDGATTVDGGACTPDTRCLIGRNEGAITAITLDASNVYFCSYPAVATIAKTGGIATPVARVSDDCSRILVDDSSLFVLDGNQIFRFPRSGGAPVRMVDITEDTQQWSLVAIDDTKLYWVGKQSTGFALKSMPKQGGPTSVLTTNGDFRFGRLVVRDGYAYWQGASNYINRVATNVTTPTMPSTIALSQAAGDLAVDSSAIFYSVNGSVGSTNGSVWKISLSNGSFTKLVDTSTFNASPIAINSSSVYWVDNGSISKVDKSGANARVVATSTAGTQVLAADDTFTFWAEGGQLIRAPR